MIELFMEGGWGMWPVLVFGSVLLGAAATFAFRPDHRRLAFLAAMAATTLLSTAHATWTDLGAVFRAMEDPQRVPDAEFQRTLMTGLKESTRPGALGGAILTVAFVLIAVGVLRAGRREEREGEGAR